VTAVIDFHAHPPHIAQGKFVSGRFCIVSQARIRRIADDREFGLAAD